MRDKNLERIFIEIDTRFANMFRQLRIPRENSLFDLKPQETKLYFTQNLMNSLTYTKYEYLDPSIGGNISKQYGDIIVNYSNNSINISGRVSDYSSLPSKIKINY